MKKVTLISVTLLIVCLYLHSIYAEVAQHQTNPTEVLTKIQGVLTQLRYTPRCDSQKVKCEYTFFSAESKTSFSVRVRYLSKGNVIHVNLLNLVNVPSNSPKKLEALEKLMDLNWRFSNYKFEWNATSGEVRISTYIQTDDGISVNSLKRLLSDIPALAALSRQEVRDVLAAPPAASQGKVLQNKAPQKALPNKVQ